MAPPLRLGVAGLGRAFTLMLPTFLADPRVALVACADPSAGNRERFAKDFSARAYDDVAALARDDDVEAIYIATPHQFHAAHAIAAARGGKHVLVEKPMALSLEECDAMIAAARAAKVHLVIGHSHSFDAPIAAARALIASGRYGALRMITALDFTDFLYRPRRVEELDTAAGGGAIFNQGAHQIDVARFLAGGAALSVRAMTGRWDRARPTEGAYTAFLAFADGVAASLTYSGYGHFDSDEFCGWIGESGLKKDEARYGEARRALAAGGDEGAQRARQGYGDARTGSGAGATRLHPHFGLVIASCEHADLRPLPSGVMIYGDGERRLETLPPPQVPRREVIDELWAAVREGRAPVHSGEWGKATLEICRAILRSAAEGREVPLVHQVELPRA
jgi:phthalate 4,5-cis-dihydrodiol dehydrogenase